MKFATSFEPSEISLEAGLPIRATHSNLVGVVRADGAFRLVAVRPIAKGTHLFRIEGEQTHRASRYSVQIGQDLHIDLENWHSGEEILDRYYWRFMNHSCDPNVKLSLQEVIATRDISPWEDVTFDYNTNEYEMSEPFDCHCGSAHCLGTIQGFKYLTPAQQHQLAPSLAPHLSCLLSQCAETAPV